MERLAEMTFLRSSVFTRHGIFVIWSKKRRTDSHRLKLNMLADGTDVGKIKTYAGLRI